MSRDTHADDLLHSRLHGDGLRVEGYGLRRLNNQSLRIATLFHRELHALGVPLTVAERNAT